METSHPVGIDLQSLKILESALTNLNEGFQELEPVEAGYFDEAQIRKVMLEVADRMKDNFPYFHPLYAGQMLKPPHPAARLAYMLSLYINPNNHALDGGRASSRMEKEAVRELAGMFGWETFLGHLTGGGTMANLEALWIAGEVNPGKMIIASSQAHYTHERLSRVLKLPFQAIPADRLGRMDMNRLEDQARTGKVGTVVATIGTTATGSLDPLPEILNLKEKFGFRVHADAAYGGYFTLADHLTAEAGKVFERLGEADSIVVDPHKHGLQPYGCGCILFRDPSVGIYYKHESPYTYFSSDELHLGEISLECSRPGASAVALWATQKLLPPVRGGELSRMIGKGREAALSLYERLRQDPRFIVAFPPELDIVIWLPRAESAEAVSKLSRALFGETGRNHLHLALAELPVDFFEPGILKTGPDQHTITSLRSVLMKPEHEEWIETIWQVLDRSMERIVKKP